MLTPAHPSQLLFFAVFFLIVESLPAQSSKELHRFDSKIDSFFKLEHRDSFFYYAELKAILAKKADSLALWGWTKRKIESILFDNPKEALEYNSNTFQQRWRVPADSAEWEPFMGLKCSRGYHHFHLGQITQSIQNYESAAQLYEKYRYFHFNTASLYNPLGNHYTRLGDNDKAIAVFQKALALGRDNESLSGLYANIGTAYWNKGDYTTAEENYRKGLNLTDVSDSKRGLLLGRLAETMLDIGRILEAARTATEALHLLRPEGPKDVNTLGYRARARRIAGVANTRLGKFAEAERLLLGALDDDRAASGEHSREVGKDQIALSKLYLQKDQALLAVAAADRALAAVLPKFVPTPPNPANFPYHSNPSYLQFYEENTIFEALTAKAQAAQALFEKEGNISWLQLALECHEYAWQAESILRRVYQYSSSKLNLQKDARDREEAAMHVARLLFEKTGQAIWLEKAFAIAERSKAALLLDALQDNLVRQRLSGSDKRFDELTTLQRSLSYFDKNLLLNANSEKAAQWRIEADGIRSKISALDKTLKQDYPTLSSLEISTANWLPNPGDFAAGEALVEYFLSEQWVDVFVFQKDKNPVWNRIPNNAALQSLIRRYLGYFENDYAILNDPAGYFQTAYSLWQAILPAETTSAAVLTILPDGILNFVPFEALVTTMDGTPSLRNAAYLLRKQEVRYAWSLAVLRQQKSLKPRPSKYLLSIAPGFANRERGLSPLVSASFDWSGIMGWNVQKMEGQSADLQHFLKKSSDFRVLHFSTHAFAGDHPRIELMDSSLLLPDLYALPLQADLVMLSACETGLGKEEKGEGVMSLARAFAQAGAACIVSSLWSVNDQSTSRLLQYFYEQIGQGKTSGTALREAKLAYLSDPSVGSAAQSPYFWAGLVAVGDDRAIEQPWGWAMWGLLLAGVTIFIFVLWWFRRKKR